ncbi:MAG: uroporphyrinogen-III C-methyltransferase [Gammaproteobacteria bacterium]|nr:uroporphyrinogen-III C-methyltransferase [Gammaproteobacteria bacterium]
MSKNKNQPNKRPSNVSRKNNGKATVPANEKNTVDTNTDATNDSTKSPVEKKIAGDKVAQESKINDTVVNETSGKDTAKNTKEAATTDTKPAAKTEMKETKQTPETAQAQSKPQASTTSKKLNSETKPKPTPTLNKATEIQPQKKGGLIAAVALLLGVAGTGLGAYSFNELRMLKAKTSTGQDYTKQISGLEKQVASLLQGGESKNIDKQLSDLTAQLESLKATEAKVNQRIAEIEQMQNGLSKSVKTDVDNALQARMSGVEALLTKVKEIEMSQKGLSKGLNQVSAGSQAINTSAMGRQEVGYLLRMAHYKLQSERDVLGATGLLKMAESKLLVIDKGESNELVDAIRAKIIQLSGVETVDTDALIADVKAIGKVIPQLTVKKVVAKSTASQASTKDAKKETSSVLGKLGSVIASGVKYTPKDPSKIDISAETILIEKRLMQADVRTAEFAIQSHNKVLLQQSIQSLKESLSKYFADDSNLQIITSKLDSLSQRELETSLPNLAVLVQQFESTQP